MAFVVDAEPPKPLIGWATRVSILHPEVCCCRNNQKHEGSQTAERAPSCQSIQHRGEAGGSAVLLNIQQLFREERTGWRKEHGLDLILSGLLFDVPTFTSYPYKLSLSTTEHRCWIKNVSSYNKERRFGESASAKNIHNNTLLMSTQDQQRWHFFANSTFQSATFLLSFLIHIGHLAAQLL